MARFPSVKLSKFWKLLQPKIESGTFIPRTRYWGGISFDLVLSNIDTSWMPFTRVKRRTGKRLREARQNRVRYKAEKTVGSL